MHHEDSCWIVAASEVMRAVLENARTVANTRVTVLITGETGVGKGVLAKQIHRWSNRADRPFVSVHCGAIPDSLLESELFGHEKGAFTGAHRRKRGKFELADGGTLFLDEVGTISSAVQIKVLDVLQERCFDRLGGEREIEVDTRIIAATNSDLDAMQREGRFRSDLYHRLNVFPIEIPPLRERKEDLPALVAHLLERLNARYSKQIEGLEPAVEAACAAYDWPGNVREMENVLERAHILEPSTRISARYVPFDVLDAAASPLAPALPVGGPGTLAAARSAAVAAAERRYLVELLAAHEGRMDASARTAGITTRQLRKLLARYQVRKTDFKRPIASRGPSRRGRREGLREISRPART